MNETIPLYPIPETKTLVLPMKKIWFRKILKGEKKEEYRLANHYWISRVNNWIGNSIFNHPILSIKFKNGYQKDSPFFIATVESFLSRSNSIHPEWGEDDYQGKEHYVFRLGTITHKFKC